MSNAIGSLLFILICEVTVFGVFITCFLYHILVKLEEDDSHD